jgi:hypothetical protein
MSHTERAEAIKTTLKLLANRPDLSGCLDSPEDILSRHIEKLKGHVEVEGDIEDKKALFALTRSAAVHSRYGIFTLEVNI